MSRWQLTPKQLTEAKKVYAATGSYVRAAVVLSERWQRRVPKSTLHRWLCDEAIPFSEATSKYQADWGPDECITELRRVVELYPERVITRNFFRNEATCSEATWTRFFGTFQEFKCAAGITPSRHARRLEKSIAKHAAHDSFRLLNEERTRWEDAYLKPTSRRWQTYLIASDIHDIDCDEFWLKLFLETAGRVQPDKVIIGGDLFDLPEFSSYTVDPRSWDVTGRIRWVHKFFKRLREACPEAELHLIEGNHEYRLLRHLAEATPALKAVLADLHGMTVANLLGLERYEVNYVGRSNLGAFTKSDLKKEVEKSYKLFDDALLVHHFPHAKSWGYAGCNGHHHKHQVTPLFSPRVGSYSWHQLGCGHRRHAAYMDASIWELGFAMAHVDTTACKVAWDYIEIRDHAVIGGRWYVRETETS